MTVTTKPLRTRFVFEIAERTQSIQACGKSPRVTEWICSTLYILCARHGGRGGFEYIIGEEMENVCLTGDPSSQGVRQMMTVEYREEGPTTQCCSPGILSGHPEVLHILGHCCSFWSCCVWRHLPCVPLITWV